MHSIKHNQTYSAKATPTLLEIPLEIRQEILSYLLCSQTLLKDYPLFAQRYSECKTDFCKTCTGTRRPVMSENEICHECLAKLCEANSEMQPNVGSLSEQTSSPGNIAFTDELRRTKMYRPRKMYRLYPEVLRVSKQLYHEGGDLLYKNKTAFIIYYAEPHENYATYVLGENSVASALGRYPRLRQIKTWSIELALEDCHKTGCGCWQGEDPDPYGMSKFKDYLENEVNAFLTIDNLQPTSWAARFCCGDPDTQYSPGEAFNYAVQPFAALRRAREETLLNGSNDD